jgi:hypothetical protein
VKQLQIVPTPSQVLLNAGNAASLFGSGFIEGEQQFDLEPWM